MGYGPTAQPALYSEAGEAFGVSLDFHASVSVGGIAMLCALCSYRLFSGRVSYGSEAC